MSLLAGSVSSYYVMLLRDTEHDPHSMTGNTAPPTVTVQSISYKPS